MSELPARYDGVPEPPAMDVAQLQGRIALFLQSGAGDPAARDLLEQVLRTLAQVEAQCVGPCQQLTAITQRHFARIETALKAVENILISDGK